jgi:hypothetical protein
VVVLDDRKHDPGRDLDHTKQRKNMSIDARVKTVYHYENGSGKLELVDRPPSRPNDTGGIKGQSSLCFDSAPEEVTALNGLDIWGSSGSVMLGDIEIAKRIGYTGLAFCDGEKFKEAVRKYHERTAKKAA